MVINEKILLSYGAEYLDLQIGDSIFKEGETPYYYYQLVTGSIKLFNRLSLNKEIVLCFLKDGNCIGESYFFSTQLYTVNSEALQPSTIIRLKLSRLMMLLNECKECAENLFKSYCKSANYYNLMMKAISQKDPEIAVLAYFSYLKNENNNKVTLIPYTRKQIGSLTGLRTETVIRIVLRLEEKRLLGIIKGKIYF
ncbi:Crp/Fnr family transcriptional regulator [Chryseobacterium foetidum]|uniref:Crp/Fnr family transcriptional regulator n=1 Tax=Chryseobacterium foetidum TaxID=2951057 RepID=UPI0021C597FC|nr:Crp/Fnr family transcriptional regulator [Chryseobacterium foetidum]